MVRVSVSKFAEKSMKVKFACLRILKKEGFWGQRISEN